MYWADGKNWASHRVAAEDYYGAIPAGAHTLHHCDNPPCVNAKHLYFGTDQDNVNDKVRRGRETRGESINTAKLTGKDVREIRRELPFTTERALGKVYGVTGSTIHKVKSRDSWKHITD